MNVARHQHASGIVSDSETGETIVVTAGGLDDGDSLDSTEILIDNTWIMGRKNFVYLCNTNYSLPNRFLFKNPLFLS